MNPRYTALKILAEVIIHHHSMTDALHRRLRRHSPIRDHGFIQYLCFGVLRLYPRLAMMLDQLLEKPFTKKNADLRVLLLMGLYQLFYMEVPEHAVISETVNTVVDCRKAWAKGFVNGVLRNAQRQAQQLKNLYPDNPVFKYAHPEWMINQFKNDYPKFWQEMLIANNQHPPMTIRVNLQRTSRQDYLKALMNKGIDAAVSQLNTTAIILKQAVDVTELPGFAEGNCSVQDIGAQFAPQLLDIKPDHRVLDSCAGPGGKMAHILEFEPQLKMVVGLEPVQDRLDRIAENLKRLGLEATLFCEYAENIDAWWDGQLFDRILIDAPCSGSGVIRRHPDIKLLRRESDINQFSQQQFQLLNRLWPLLKPGGMLLYITCSIFPEENEQVMERFLQGHQDAREMLIEESWGIAQKYGRVILPGQGQMDGFYYGRLRKLS